MTLLKTTLLLVASNFFMLCAWYLHPRMKFLEGRPIALAILVSWGIAFFEYVLQVPANRIGYAGGINFFQLKFLQEIIISLGRDCRSALMRLVHITQFVLG